MSRSPFYWKVSENVERLVDRTSSQLFEVPLANVLLDELKSGGTGWHDDFATVDHKDVQDWVDFDEKTLEQIMYGLSDEVIPWTVRDENSLQSARQMTYKIITEDDIDDMIKQSMVIPINHSISYICPQIRRNHNAHAVDLGMKCRGVAITIKSAKVERAEEGKRFSVSNKKPDWPIYEKGSQRSADNIPAQVYVAGETKRHRVFDPEWLKDDNDYKGKKANVSIGQVGMYCYHGKTRYGFIITSTTFTALRYNFIAKEDKKLRMGVEYKIIPLTAAGRQLTVVKAIVSLAALSVHDKHRDVVPKSEIAALNVWYRHEANHTAVFAHIVTERLERSVPDSAQVTSDPAILKHLSATCQKEMESMTKPLSESTRPRSLDQEIRASTAAETKKSQSRDNTLHEVRDSGKTKVKKPKLRRPSAVLKFSEPSRGSSSSTSSQ